MIHNVWSSKFFLLILSCALLAASSASAQTVAFPGPAPGAAHAVASDGKFTLSNNLLSLTWQVGEHGRLVPSGISNALNPQKPEPGARELFRISTAQSTVQPGTDGFYLGLRVERDTVSAVWGNGQSWRVLKSFPRAAFAGDPALLRCGKLSLNGDGADYPDPGAMGSCTISEISPEIATAPELHQSPQPNTKLTFSDRRLELSADANTAAYAQWSVPTGTSFVSARIQKKTDQGMSWGPGLALVWPNGQFVLVNSRTPLGEFSVVTKDGENVISNVQPAIDFNLPSSSFHLTAPPRITSVPGGKAVMATLKSDTTPLTVSWRAILRDNAHYVRQVVDIDSRGAAGMLTGIELVDFPVAGTVQVGDVPGSPIAGANWFFGCELPMGVNDTANGARSAVACRLPLDNGSSYTFSSVAGVYPDGQLRRSVLSYVERERARPTRPFLEYNCWYDLAQGVTDATFADAISGFYHELTTKRGVKLDSYVIDDGWDDHVNTFWGVDPVKFPNGFAPLAKQLKADGTHLGLWISPLGGYSERPMRTENARKLGLVDGASLDLSNPKYYAWFRDYLLKLIQTYQVNYFKWDKAGDGVTPHFMALLRVAGDLRQRDPNLFLNVTVGTWPSPFWLNHIDCTWRGGADVGWTGVGDKREQWLTYRDMEIYRNVVQRAPLYPLNSIMHHGIALGRFYQGKDLSAVGPDLRHDARVYFANGATLQELYLTPSLMSQAGWDDIAASAKWSHANSDVLADSHWIGGDPGNGDVYGYASWSPRKGIFVLRNPSAVPESLNMDAQTAFELPIGAKQHYKLVSPYSDQRIQGGELRAGVPTAFDLQPFEVLVFEALPE